MRSSTPRRLQMSMQVGIKDSPTLKRGKASRSAIATRRPLWARKVAAVVPPGPAPTTSTSASRGSVVTLGILPDPAPRGEYAAARLPHVGPHVSLRRARGGYGHG